MHPKIDPKLAIEALWKAGKLRYKLHTAQQKIYDGLESLDPKTREVLLFISRRFGKSYWVVVKACEDAIKSGKCVLIMGPTLKQTRAIVTPLMARIVADAPKGFVQETKSELKWKVGKGEVMLGGFDLALESLRGLEFQTVYLEETGLAEAEPEEYEYILNSVVAPTLMHTRGRIIHATTPAKKIEHPLHTITIPKTKKLGTFYTYTIRDNPLLTKAQIEEEIDKMGGMESIHVRRELFCEICKDETTAIVPNFDRDKVVTSLNIEPEQVVIVSGDFGGVRDKSVFHLIGCEKETGRILFLDERSFEPETPTMSIIRELRDMERGHKISRFVDCPGQLDIDLATTHRYPILRPRKKAFETGVTELRNAFDNDRVRIDHKCQMLIVTLEHGGFNRQRTDFFRNTELGHCDAVASAIYGVRHFFEKFPPRKIDPNQYHRTKQKPSAGLGGLLDKVFRI